MGKSTTDIVVERRDMQLDTLLAHPRNYNRHGESQLKKIMASLRKFGQVRSVVVWRNYVLAGHGVVEAARRVKRSTIRADVLPDDYPERLALAYVVADNEIARQSDPDMAQLAAIIDESRQSDSELLEAMGYSASEFDDLLREIGQGGGGGEAGKDTEPQVDKAEELRQKWGVELGQLWQLGEHRLICGDCTDRAVVERVIGGERAGIVTDPPYAFGLASTSQLSSKSGGWHDMMNNASWFAGLYRQWNDLISDGPLWVFTNWRTLPILMKASFDSGVTWIVLRFGTKIG